MCKKDKRIAELEEENRKLRSMCKAAAVEIAEVWDAHCDPLGYGPTNLIARLEGRLPPDLYPEQYVCTVNAPEIEHTCVWDDGNPKDCEEAAQGISKEDCEYWTKDYAQLKIASKGYVRGGKSD